MRKSLSAFIIPLVFVINLTAQKASFNQDSAYQYIRVLSEDIGPRPMGSFKELEALYWAVHKYNSFGADTAYIIPFTKGKSARRNLNTLSGVAVGIFKGKMDSSIVVGGHIDSEAPEVPGANDNASGTATAMELARIWSERDRNYTMVFCAFGGEEKGLIGSRNFVESYGDIDKVKLMISTDMGGSPSEIVMMFETDSIQAPKWLVQDAFKIAEEQHLNRLEYPTHYSTLNSISKGGSGSDHMSFLTKGIPAIDFTSGMNDSPIHTSQDRLEFIDIAALGSYGNFVDALIQHYQEHGISSRQNPRFMLWELLGIRLYLSGWFIAMLLVLEHFVLLLNFDLVHIPILFHFHLAVDFPHLLVL